jgi:hypothetical protein
MKTNILRKIVAAVMLFATAVSFAQGPPPPNGCDLFYALDSNNDGFAEFNMAALFAAVAADAMADHGWDTSGYIMTAYTSETDRDLGINAIGETYWNVNAFEQNIYIGFIYSGSGPVLEDPDLFSMTCWSLTTVPSNGDADSDGVPNANEDVNGNGSLNDDNTDGDLLFNFLDDDDDNDALPTLSEDYNGNGNAADDDTNSNGIPDYLENTVVLGSDHNQLSAFVVSPNPSRGAVTISFTDNNDRAARLSIFDTSGKQIKSFSGISQTIDVSGLRAGVYLLKCESQNKVSVKKLIVL